MMLTEKKFQTHRGYWLDGIMENTLESLIAAKERGSEMVEFDVRLTRDYVPVLYHDKTLARLHRAPVEMKALTLAQARVFAPNLTTLEQVLESKQVPGFFNIELKSDSATDPALEIRVGQLVKKHKVQDRVVLSSFNPFSLIRAKGFVPEVSRALLVTEENEPMNYWFLKKMNLLSLCDARFLHWENSMITQERIEKFMAMGYLIGAYTVNDAEQARELLSWGVHSIISDQLLDV